jgi:hypothetical protein
MWINAPVESAGADNCCDSRKLGRIASHLQRRYCRRPTHPPAHGLNGRQSLTLVSSLSILDLLNVSPPHR